MKRQKNGSGTFTTRKDGTIQYRVYLGVGADGKPIRPNFYGQTQRECLQKYRDWLKNSGNTPIEKVKTVGEWADKWLELYKKDSVSYGTYRNYQLYVDKHIKPAIGNLKFEQVRPAHIQKIFKNDASLSDSARHHIYVTLNGIFKTAIENHYCRENPVRPISREAVDPAAVKVFSPDQIEAILKSDHALAIYPQLLLYTGLRMGELLALKWSDVDLDDGLITVSNSVARKEGGGHEVKSTKSGKIRYIGIPGKLREILVSLPKKNFYVIPGKDGFLSPHTFENRYKKFFKDTGIDYLSPHKCRHTYGTYLRKGGAELRAVQVLLGHSSSKVTEIYTHVDTNDIKDNVTKLAY